MRVCWYPMAVLCSSSSESLPVVVLDTTLLAVSGTLSELEVAMIKILFEVLSFIIVALESLLKNHVFWFFYLVTPLSLYCKRHLQKVKL